MSELALWISIGATLAAAFWLSWICFSLRDFSRSKLDEICRKQNNPERFGEILKRHEPALQVSELLLTLTIIALLGFSFTLIHQWFRQMTPAGTDAEFWGGWVAYLIEVGTVGLMVLLLILVLPWTLGRVWGEGLIFRCWPLIQALQGAGRPYLAFISRLDQIMHRLTGVEEPRQGDAAAISEEIFSVVDEGQREGLIEREARTMIHRVIELQDVEASSIMTPRTEIVTLPVTSTLEEARTVLLEEGHSRVPVIGENTDDIKGILYAKDLLRFLYGSDNGEQFDLAKIVREPMYVPETTGVDSLLQTMKLQRVQLAIVLDEYGGVSGLVTMEDVLEEIVGEIDDEYDEIEEEEIETVDENTVMVDGRVHLDELNEQFEFDLPEEGDYDTIAGFVVSELGRIPEPGETLTWKQLRITIVDADKRRIVKLQIERDPTLQEIGSEEE